MKNVSNFELIKINKIQKKKNFGFVDFWGCFGEISTAMNINTPVF